MGSMISKMVEKLWTKKMEMAVIGLENAGKTTFVSQLVGKECERTVPTVGVNVEKYSKGKLRVKLWDLGGQTQYRAEWVAYAKTCNVLAFVIDSSEPETISFCKKELFQLLECKELDGMPILVLANKIDKEGHMKSAEIVESLNLDYIDDHLWKIIPISAIRGTNMDQVAEWILSTSKVSKSKKILLS